MRELGRKFATMLNVSQSKRAKGRKPRKMGRESRKQGTGRTPSVPLPSRFSKSVIQVTLSSCTRLKEEQECLMCGKNVKFNFGKLRPAVVWAISLSNFWISIEVYFGKLYGSPK